MRKGSSGKQRLLLTEDEHLNRHRLKMRRIGNRLMAQPDKVTTSALRKRYNNHLKMAAIFDRSLKPLLKDLSKCHTEWKPAINKETSGEDDEPSGLECISITVYPTDTSCTQNIKKLLNIIEKNRRWERAVNRRVSIRTLRKDENVQFYFDGLKADKDFLMMYEIYGSAVKILSNKLLDELAVSKRIVKEIAKLTATNVEDPVELFVGSFNEKPFLRIFFELSEGMLLPKRSGNGFEILSLDELISRVFLEAREKDIFLDYLSSISSHRSECQ